MTSPSVARHLRPAALVVAIVAAVLMAGLVFTSRPAGAATSAFAQRCGIHFCFNGKPFYFAGANTYDVFTYGGSYGDTETQYMDKARIDAHMAHLQSDKVSVLRLWMFSHESWHGFETAKGVYNDQQFALFDYVIQSAKAHSIMLIPVFENYWEAYGGIDTRLSWEGLSGGQPGRAKFFNKAQCPGCFTQYKNYVNYALNRVNHYSGVKYKDDPSIFAWELMNEPRYQDVSADENVSGATLRAWVDEMGAYVKSIDPNHLLDAGLEGHGTKYGFGGDEGNPFVYIQQSPYIDFTSAHPYPDEGWAGLDIPKTKTLIRAWISDSHNVVGKPFFMGEWNVHQDWTNWWSQIYTDFEAADGDGDAFWWYKDGSGGGGFDTVYGAAQLSVFRQHSANMTAKSTGTPPSSSASPVPTVSLSLSPSPTRSASPSPSASASPSVSPSPSTSPTGSAGTSCLATYHVDNSWGTGFNATVTLKNTGSTTFANWTLTFTAPSGVSLGNGWNGTWSFASPTFTVQAPGWATSLAPGATWSPAYTGNGPSSPTPTGFKLNGVACATA
ncbi:cellulose binding domain-containing protein [Hamadaea tsunoensis]|uniref:cellulose binding domain-containing protein n=1 Tax=Hamadaea tsunoensis TaxID=53368 RepID=UPI00040FB210|nr:cellulose binding domain-containing protein [Hamadaea tsunoensis]